MAEAPLREDGPDAAEARLSRLLNLIVESAVAALGFDAATVTARSRSTRPSVSPVKGRAWRCWSRMSRFR
jgi:hypothetical protein